jgi:endonuclease/exonuclease/phosphatase family metal-dependent hydrolase
MKRGLWVLIFIAVCLYTQAQSFPVMTFNLRYDNPADGLDKWENRRTELIGMIKHYSPRILGIQEGLVNQVEYLAQQLSGYRYVGVGRDDGRQKGEFSAIFYDTTLFKALGSGTFWLSETPDKPSVGWDAALERICTWVQLEDIHNKSRCWVFNTHFDHIGKKARIESANLIVRKIKELNLAHLPVILMGDFNSGPGSDPILILRSQLTEASVISAKPLYGPKGTFNSFSPSNAVDECIDFIFVSSFFVESCTHIDDKKNDNHCLSDHYPVLAELRLLTMIKSGRK